jgi:hypothetical protein
MPLRVASVWLALAVALLSSLMASGLPRTTSFGSAFNPATTAVALQPNRAQPRVLVEQVRRDDDPARGQGTTVPVPTGGLQPAVRSPAAAVSPKPAAAVRLVAPHDGLDGSPRGPPLT